MSLLAPNKHSTGKNRYGHRPRHNHGTGKLPVAQLVKPKNHTPHRHHEAQRQRGNRLGAVARHAAHLLLKRRHAQTPQAPEKVIARARVPERTAAPRGVQPLPLDIFDTLENIKLENTYKVPTGQEMSLNTPPVATGREAYDKLGVDVGAIIAYFDLPINEGAEYTEKEKAARRIYVVNRADRLGAPKHATQPELVLVGHGQLEQMVQSQRDGGQTPKPRLETDMPVVRPGKPVSIGRNEWLPYDTDYVSGGVVTGVRPEMYDAVSGLQARVEIDQENGGFYVQGLGKNKMTVVVGTNRDPGTAQDPWAGSTAGTYEERAWRNRQESLRAHRLGHV
ncbi:MAG TPA: hypothetical protein VLE73_06905 [Candidatus Saccharimonadales bacterium]|nr:hypothetical protein [Candidatus Saccharimonadales bacterium]